MSDIVVSEDCPSSNNEHGTHCDHWYEDEGCHWCGTQEPNLVVFEIPDAPQTCGLAGCDKPYDETVGNIPLCKNHAGEALRMAVRLLFGGIGPTEMFGQS